jgi:hypothetical protein
VGAGGRHGDGATRNAAAARPQNVARARVARTALAVHRGRPRDEPGRARPVTDSVRVTGRGRPPPVDATTGGDMDGDWPAAAAPHAHTHARAHRAIKTHWQHRHGHPRSTCNKRARYPARGQPRTQRRRHHSPMVGDVPLGAATTAKHTAMVMASNLDAQSQRFTGRVKPALEPRPAPPARTNDHDVSTVRWGPGSSARVGTQHPHAQRTHKRSACTHRNTRTHATPMRST